MFQSPPQKKISKRNQARRLFAALPSGFWASSPQSWRSSSPVSSTAAWCAASLSDDSSAWPRRCSARRSGSAGFARCAPSTQRRESFEARWSFRVRSRVGVGGLEVCVEELGVDGGGQAWGLEDLSWENALCMTRWDKHHWRGKEIRCGTWRIPQRT